MVSKDKLSQLTEYLTYDDVLLLPNYSEILPGDTDISAQLTKNVRLETPIVASPMDTVCEARMAIEISRLGGVGFLHRNLPIEEQARQLSEALKETSIVGAAVGVGADMHDRLTALVDAGLTIVAIDTAHGHTKNVLDAVKHIAKKHPQLEIVAGNVATYEGAKALFEAGATTVKVGMGPGSICTTRVVSGMGVPQLTAVVEGVRAAKECGGHIIADGGIKTSGDIVKALAAGADTVMLGSLLAGTDEAPGEVIQLQGKLFKSYRGMGSIAAMKQGSAGRYGQKWESGRTKKLVPEGVEGLVPHRGDLESHLHRLSGGLRSGMGYLGAQNLTELEQKAHFIKISRSAQVESSPHSIVVK